MPLGPQVGIRELREAHGLTVNQLVERIKDLGYDGNLHPDTVRNVELGHKRASKQLVVLWAKALGLLPMDIWQPPIESRSDAVAVSA